MNSIHPWNLKISNNREQTIQNWGSSKSTYLGRRSLVTGYLSVISREVWNLCFFVARRTSLLTCLCSECRHFPLANRDTLGVSVSTSSELLEYAEGEAILKVKQQGRRSNKGSKKQRGLEKNQQYYVEYRSWCVEMRNRVSRHGAKGFKVEKIDQITTHDERIGYIPFHKDLWGHFEI